MTLETRSTLLRPLGGRFGGVSLAVLAVTVLALVDYSAGPTVVVAGLITVGPCLTAIANGPRAVLAIGAYTVLMLVLLSGPDHLWWTTQQLIYLLALIAVTAVSVAAARQRERQERMLVEAEREMARVSAASVAKTDLLSRVSHELRTPLNAVLGFGQLLEREPLTPPQHEATAQITRAGEHLLALVDDVLDVSAIESGGLSLSIEAVRVSEAVRYAVELTGHQARSAQITLEVDDAGEAAGLHVLADARRLRQVLVNLLSNAIKFSSAPAVVRVRVVERRPHEVSIAVADDGRGIASEDLPKLFMPFERLGATAAGIDGTGMGLAVSRGLVEAMGGSLAVDSKVGEGATFTVTLAATVEPSVAPPAVVAAASEREVPERSRAAVKVLYVEDNLANVRLMQRVLERRPEWAMTHAATGTAGLELALAERFDLILLDQNLPDKDGLTVLRTVRESEAGDHVPVVMITADASAQQRERASAAGADDSVIKPYVIDDLLAVLDAHAGRPLG